MRAIPLILLVLAGCGNDSTVAVSADMSIPRTGFPCEQTKTCCCGSPNFPSPCIEATPGQQCSAGQTCDFDVEQGGYCFCAANTWMCIHSGMDMTMLLDMSDHD